MSREGFSMSDHAPRDFAARQLRNILLGCLLGSLAAATLHLVLRDSRFVPTVRALWSGSALGKGFDGLEAYRLELTILFFSIAATAVTPVFLRIWRYARACGPASPVLLPLRRPAQPSTPWFGGAMVIG